MAGPDPQNPFANAFVRGMRELGYTYGQSDRADHPAVAAAAGGFGDRLMERRMVVAGLAAMVFAPIVRVDHTCASNQDPLERLYAVTAALVSKYYPDAKMELTRQRIHFEARTRRFMVHEQLKTGEWQDAHETVGPQRGGVVGNMDLRSGKFPGAAAVPQSFDKRYFTLLVMAPYSEARDAHLYTHLLYPADVSKVFLSEFTDLVTRFAEYLI
jgi:hypothetical protein